MLAHKQSGTLEGVERGGARQRRPRRSVAGLCMAGPELIGELCAVKEDPRGAARPLWDRYDNAVIMPTYLV